MCPDPGVRDPLDQLGVFVYQPSLPQYVGGGIFKLKNGGEVWRGWVVFTVYGDWNIRVSHLYCKSCSNNFVKAFTDVNHFLV